MASSDTDDDIIISSAFVNRFNTLSEVSGELNNYVGYNKNKKLYGNTKSTMTCKKTIDQSQLGDKARNRRKIQMVHIEQFCCSYWQKLGSS